MIIDLCEQLLLELQKSRSLVPLYLQPGISRSDVERSLQVAGIDISLPEEVYSLYGWRNGIDEDESDSESTPFGQLQLFTLGIYISLNLAIQEYAQNAIRQSYWPKTLFPLFGSVGGDYYLIDTGNTSLTYGMIMYYSPANPYFQGAVSIFDSLESCLRSVTECYSTKAYHFDLDSHYFEIDALREKAIWRKHNPRSEYYKILDKFK